MIIDNDQLPEGYQQTEVGVIPDDWEVSLLVNLAEIRSGIAKNSNTSVKNPVFVYYLRVANVQNGFLDLSEMSQLQVSHEDVKRYAVLPGDMLMNEGGDLDKLGRGTFSNSRCRRATAISAFESSSSLCKKLMSFIFLLRVAIIELSIS